MYTEDELKEFNLEDIRPSNIPMDPGYVKRQAIHTDVRDKEAHRLATGSLLYLATNTRLDIAVGTKKLTDLLLDHCYIWQQILDDIAVGTSIFC